MDNQKKISSVSEDENIRVGILHNNYINGICRSEVPGRYEDVFIDRKDLNGAPFGMRVVCKVTNDPGNENLKPYEFFKDEITGEGMPRGEIIGVLGDPASNDSTMEGIIISHNLKQEFSKEALVQADGYPGEIENEEVEAEIQKNRVDLRDEIIVTIDGEDTKDIDDGISVRKEKGITYLGVHIADVAHYVTEGSAIDKEAYERGCSVYMADRVLPMLPPVLSNNLCSLNPGKIRFALSAIIGFDDEYNQVSFEIFESVIKSKERLTYNQVYNLLEENEKADNTIIEYKPMLSEIKKLSEQLRKKRFENGSIDFDFAETKIKLDGNKNVTEIYAAENTFAHQMIEECMIACNEAVSKAFTKKKSPFIYRIHKDPDPDKIGVFIGVAKLLGENIKIQKKPGPKDIQNIVSTIKNKPYKETLMQLLLRSMSKAVYSDKCDGHFGLAIKYYSHFTSPIRRYPDLFIHRVIKRNLCNMPPRAKWKALAGEVAIQSSDSEIRAMLAERDSVDYKVAEYMKQFEGKTFEGKVTGLQDFGIFVKLENTAEGMAPFRVLKNYYQYFEDEMMVKSRQTGKIIRIGDKVRVKVADADIIARRIEFLLEEPDELSGKNKKEKKESYKKTKYTSGKKKKSAGKKKKPSTPKKRQGKNKNKK